MILFSNPRLTATILDWQGTYLVTCQSLDFAKRNAERHLQTGRIIGQNPFVGRLILTAALTPVSDAS